MISEEIKTWPIIQGAVTCRMMITNSVKRIDLRCVSKGRFTKGGVSLTASELNYCMAFADNFNELPGMACFFNLKLWKEGRNCFSIQKGEKPQVITTLDFWKALKPLVPAMKYLISEQNLPLNQLLDLSLLSTLMPEKDLLNRKWPENVKDYNPYKSPLQHLGFIKLDNSIVRKIDTESLNQFLIDDSILFDSLVKFMYI